MSTLTWPVKVKANRDWFSPGVSEPNLAQSTAGDVVVTKSVTVGQNGSTAVDGLIYIPRYCTITDIKILIGTAFDSATSNTLSIGFSSAGTELVTSANVKAAAGLLPLTATHVTATQVPNWLTTGTNTTIYCTQTPVGAASTGSVTVKITYTVPNPDNITHPSVP